jgi:hypothetical protein
MEAWQCYFLSGRARRSTSKSIITVWRARKDI